MKNSNRICYLCGCTDHFNRPGRVRDDSTLGILECKRCGLVFLSRIVPSDGFYEKSGMHGDKVVEIDDWLLQIERDDNRRIEYLKEAIANKVLLDFGCGPGGFLLKAQPKARSVIGIELESRLQLHFQKNALNVVRYIQDLPFNQKFDLITAFHVIEHLEDPAEILRQLATKLEENGKIIIEIPSSSDSLLTLFNSVPFSEFTYWSCHLFLFNSSNAHLLAKKAGLKLEYVDHIQRYPLSNHLYWLAKGKPGGHQLWNYIDSQELSTAYEARLAALGITDTIIVCFSPL